MRGTVICRICATLQAGRRHKWLSSYGHRIGCALIAKMSSPPTARWLSTTLHPPPVLYGPYSPECVEGDFSEVELPIYGVLRSSAKPCPRKVTHETRQYDVMQTVCKWC